MAINSVRLVRYTDEGCSLYQCLYCYEYTETRDDVTNKWEYCPYCAIRWMPLEINRTADEPKWMSVLMKGKSDEERYKLESEIWKRQYQTLKDHEPKSYWMIEYKFIFGNRVQNWTPEEYGNAKTTRLDVIKRLEELRKYASKDFGVSDPKIFYRARITKAPRPMFSKTIPKYYE